MKSFLFYLLSGMLSLMIHRQATAQTEEALFTSSTTFLHAAKIVKSFPVKVISFHANISHNKVLMQWVIGENETAEQFEVEKSVDGKNFSVAALVFGTDKSQTETYMFYEKSSSKKVFYRIKCVDKDQNISYSDILAIDPAGN